MESTNNLRLACAYAALPPRDPQRAALAHSVRGFVVDESRWEPKLEGFSVPWRWSRGFPEGTLQIEMAGFIDRAAELFARAPTLREVWLRFSLRPMSEVLEKLLALPEVARLRSLRITGGGMVYTRVDGAGAAAIAACPHLSQLKSLTLHGNAVDDAGLAALVRAPALPALEDLALLGNKIGPRGAKAVAQDPAAARLRALDLDDNKVKDSGAKALATSPHLAGLRWLGLKGNGIGPPGGAALAASTTLPANLVLALYDNDVGVAPLQALKARYREVLT
jgi:hypothetical protein